LGPLSQSVLFLPSSLPHLCLFLWPFLSNFQPPFIRRRFIPLRLFQIWMKCMLLNPPPHLPNPNLLQITSSSSLFAMHHNHHHHHLLPMTLLIMLKTKLPLSSHAQIDQRSTSSPLLTLEESPEYFSFPFIAIKDRSYFSFASFTLN
jgi:hypothetical protein